MNYRRSGAVVCLWILAAVWFLVVVGAGFSMALQSSVSGREYVVLAVYSLLFGLLPAAGVLWHDKALEQRHKRRMDTPDPLRPNGVRSLPPAPPSRQLPGRLHPQWNRLMQAWNVVADLQRQGWVDSDSTRGLPESIARLHRLGVADGMTDQLGGRRSDTVERQIGRLADLLVALADEAVDHQAAIGAGDFVPATLAAAAQRLAIDSAAYRELMELGGTWAAPLPAADGRDADDGRRVSGG